MTPQPPNMMPQGRPPVGMAPPTAASQPSLDSVIHGLQAAIQAEPEQADRQALEGALQVVTAVNAKNQREQKTGK